MAAMASSVGVLERSQFTGAVEALERSSSNAGSRLTPRRLVLRAQQQNEAPTSRRGLLGFMAVGIAAGLASSEAKAVSKIQVTGPPPPSGGLPGTENADQPRDLDLPLKERFYIQPLTPTEAVTRVKDASKDIVGVKDLIAKKSWPYVRNDLRNKATYLRYDLQTIISSKPKSEAKEIKKLSKKLFETMDSLDYAARSKDPSAAEKSYDATVAALNDVISIL